MTHNKPTITNNIPYTAVVETTAIGCYSEAKATATDLTTGLPKHYYSKHMHCHWLGPAVLISYCHQTRTFPALTDWALYSAVDNLMWTD